MNQFLSLAYLFTVGNGLFLSVLLFLRRGIAGKIFSLLVLCCSFEIFMQYVWRTGLCFRGLEYVSSVRNGICFLFGPLLYAYFLTVGGKRLIVRAKQLLHLLPAIAVVVSSVGKIALSGHDRSNHLNVSHETFFYACVLISILFYLGISVKHAGPVLKKSKGNEAILFHGKWGTILALYCGLTVLVFSVAVAGYVSGAAYAYTCTHYLSACLAIPVYFNGYVTVVRHDQYRFIHRDERGPQDIPLSAKIKYSKNRLPRSRSGEILLMILASLDGEKAYLDPEMTIERFSKNIGVHPHHVSQVINDRLRVNYYALMNSRRVEEAKRILSREDLTVVNILNIAYDSGFNSKTTFNSVFKRSTGLTPSEYRERIRSAAPRFRSSNRLSASGEKTSEHI